MQSVISSSKIEIEMPKAYEAKMKAFYFSLHNHIPLYAHNLTYNTYSKWVKNDQLELAPIFS